MIDAMANPRSGILKPNSQPTVVVQTVDSVQADGISFAKVYCELDFHHIVLRPRPIPALQDGS